MRIAPFHEIHPFYAGTGRRALRPLERRIRNESEALGYRGEISDLPENISRRFERIEIKWKRRWDCSNGSNMGGALPAAS